jgi:hypothetical protein
VKITLLLVIVLSAVAFHVIQNDRWSTIAPGQSAKSFCTPIPSSALPGGGTEMAC